MKIPRSPYPYMVVGATLLAAFIYLMANIQDEIEERQKEVEQEIIQSREARLNQWRQADTGFGSEKSYVLSSPLAEIAGTNTKLTLMVVRLPDGVEAIGLSFTKPPPMALGQQFRARVLAYSHPNLLSSVDKVILFESESSELFYVTPRYADISWIMEKLNSSYYDRLTFGFAGWYKDSKPVVATIDIEKGKPALERMIRDAKNNH